MDLTQMSTPGLLKLHHAIREALEFDDNQSTTEAKVYGVRTFPDWRTWADALEAELDKRNAHYSKLAW